MEATLNEIMSSVLAETHRTSKGEVRGSCYIVVQVNFERFKK